MTSFQIGGSRKWYFEGSYISQKSNKANAAKTQMTDYSGNSFLTPKLNKEFTPHPFLRYLS